MINADLDIRNGVVGILQNKKNSEYLIVEAIKDIVKESIAQGHLDRTIGKVFDNAIDGIAKDIRTHAENICNEYMTYYFHSEEFKEEVLYPMIEDCVNNT